MLKKIKVVYGGRSTKWTLWKRKNSKSKSRLDVQFVKKNDLDNGYWSTDEERGTWSNLLFALALQILFVSYLRFRLSR